MIDLLPLFNPRKNVFNLLGLPVEADAKTIRHRKEDIDAAFATGSAATEFSHVHSPGDKTMPDADEVGGAFSTLGDPEARLIHALFWFWPLGDGIGGDPVRLATAGSPAGLETAIENWKEAPCTTESERVFLFHNMALAHLFLAQYADERLLERAEQELDSEESGPNGAVHWNQSMVSWKEIIDNETFWWEVGRKAAGMNDPRMPRTLVRRIRRTLPADLFRLRLVSAERFSAVDLPLAAKRHMDFLREGRFWDVDVAGLVEDRTEEIRRGTTRILESARTDPARARNGLALGSRILRDTVVPVRTVKTLLGPDNRESISFCNEIARCIHGLLSDSQAIEAGDNLEECERVLNECLVLTKDTRLRREIQNDLLLCQPDFVDQSMNRFRQMTGRPPEFVRKPKRNTAGKPVAGTKRTPNAQEKNPTKPHIYPNRTSFPEDNMPDERPNGLSRLLLWIIVALVLFIVFSFVAAAARNP